MKDMYQIQRQDILEWAREYQGEKFHSLLTDAPYHLTSITKRFGKEGSAPAKGDVYRRASAGFMSQTWDGGGISFDPATWAALAELLYPGAFGMTFASPRTHHRIACAIEDAGMIIQPTFYCWLYLSGFPKATRIKGEDNFNGHRYGGQCIKPAVEPVIIFQKPYEGRPVENIVRTGAGALNIEAGRIGTDSVVSRKGLGQNRLLNDDGWIGIGHRPEPETNTGRWPANFILSHSPFCNGECHPDCPVRLFDEQAGESVSRANEVSDNRKTEFYQAGGNKTGGYAGERNPGNSYSDSGPASRMFHQSDWAYEVAEQLANAEPVRYEPKVSSSEREAGLEELEMRTRHRVNAGGLENEPRFAPAQVKNNHPTLKPISLTKYLATLLLPPTAYSPRRILVPFAGVGSEMIGAILAGWEEVIGIEQSAEYCQIAEARLRWWSQWPGWGQTDVDAILAADKDKEDDRQLSLFDDEVARRGQAA